MLRTLLPLALTLAACSTPQGPPLHEAAGEINLSLYEGLDRLSPGDAFDLKFSYDTEYDQTLKVLGDGQCSFVGLGTRQVAGLLPSELEAQLQEAYAAVLPGRDPSVAVVVREQALDQVYVMGEVRSPGAHALPRSGEMSFLQALSLAGGFDKSSSWLSNVLLVRYDPATRTQRSWVVDARPQHWGEADALILQEYDVIFVPNTRIDQAIINVNNWVWGILPIGGNNAARLFAPGTPGT